MASSVLENCTYIIDRDGMKRAEALEIDESLFTFLLEESQDEGCSGERLNSIIQSLEAEINHTTIAEVHDYDIDIEMLSNDGNSNCQMCHVEDGHEWPYNNSLLECADQLELAPCPIGEDMDLYMDTHGHEMADLLEFESLSDYSNVYGELQIQGQGCSSLWHQTWAMTQ